MAGRKSLREELQLFQRYSDLSEPYFKTLTKYIANGDKADEKWAVEQLGKAFVKMIPQDIANDPDNPFIIQIAQSIADKNGITSSPESDSSGQAQV